MTKTQKFFQIAKQTALCEYNDRRKYKIGAVGLRHDGMVVQARNISTQTRIQTAHAEYRLSQKLDWGSTVYVVRVLANGALSMAKPCKKCVARLRRKGVRMCYYSITDNEYGVLVL